MAAFIVISTDIEQSRLDAKIAETFGNKSYKLPKGEWLVSYDGTTKQLAAKVGLDEGTCGAGIVFSSPSYWGFAPTDIWDWLEINS